MLGEPRAFSPEHRWTQRRFEAQGKCTKTAECHGPAWREAQSNPKLLCEAIIMEELQEEVTCPVCLMVPREGGLLPCVNSHLICEKCFANLKEKICPECRVHYRNAANDQGGKPQRSRLADRVLERLARKCK